MNGAKKTYCIKRANNIVLVVAFLLIFLLLCSCSSNGSDDVVIADDPVLEARENVIKKWENEAGILGTTRYIEDVYKQYSDDEVISNIYFYCIAKEEYEHYKSLDNSDYLATAIEYAAKIDPKYDGVYADEMQSFADTVLAEKDRDSVHEKAKGSTDYYNNLTNSDKKAICEYIQERYDYYDSIDGGYAGDKYTDIIWSEISAKYGLTESQIDTIWMNLYSY